jgi:regulatory protein
MKITKIEKQKKHKDRYNIFLDGEFAFGLYEDSLLKFGLRTNDELSDKEITEIKDYDGFIFGKTVAYSYLSYKQRSRKEVIQKLRKNKIPEEVIDKIISLLVEMKYINDESYAKLYLENKLSGKPMGNRLLRIKLQEKGIDRETTEKVIDENYDEEKELQSAEKLLEKYSEKVKGKNDFEKRKKCFNYLVSRGFDFELAGRVLDLNKNLKSAAS